MNDDVELNTCFIHTTGQLNQSTNSTTRVCCAAPSHIVNEHVELAKRVMHKGSGGVANFVLRWV